MFPVAILAGGLATRLRPITEEIPKSLIEVAGKPFICHQLEYLRKQGINSVVLCIGYLGEMIEEIVGNGSQWDMHVTYSLDGSVLLGTGGALRQALPLLGEHFFILYGDSYLPIDFSDVEKTFVASGKKGLMTVLRNQNQWDKSNVEFDAGQIIEYNKTVIRPQMHYIDYGLGILQSAVLQAYPARHSFDLSKVYNDLSLARELAGYEVFERFYEIGSHQGIADTQAYLFEKTAKGTL
ncbi:nucleotidyltransferase family protein [Polynucleobacter sp. MG-5-Ahmo-C2]|uniref:nucleotidyltransferase family protein n=1 Tax=Polynucleobacter sp. MG-5-Ahmo-C2 TaxID=2081051 RepID=UPI0021118669|nr:nucleotidyltransferase family protein [Polynucleobacter sp. MG-5-Ahmo-C2]QWD98832.1 nucleotidyltransferase family protein [Polynucleobacter sp. MG-5-Ahmo-C2]